MGAEHVRRQRQMAWPELVSFGKRLAGDEMEMLLSRIRVGVPQPPSAEANMFYNAGGKG
jgi:hypothetical protein